MIARLFVSIGVLPELTSISSIPILRRIRRGSAPGSECIRCSINDSTPPKLVAGYSNQTIIPRLSNARMYVPYHEIPKQMG